MLFSPVVRLELAFLWEIHRIRVSPDEILSRLRAAIGLQMCTLSFAEVIYSSASLSWTRDVFDRLIVGQAIANGQAPLITFDELITQHYRGALC
jgi:PIN domain nuclease of toxin-antitoxin system